MVFKPCYNVTESMDNPLELIAKGFRLLYSLVFPHVLFCCKPLSPQCFYVVPLSISIIGVQRGI